MTEQEVYTKQFEQEFGYYVQMFEQSVLNARLEGTALSQLRYEYRLVLFKAYADLTGYSPDTAREIIKKHRARLKGFYDLDIPIIPHNYYSDALYVYEILEECVERVEKALWGKGCD